MTSMNSNFDTLNQVATNERTNRFAVVQQFQHRSLRTPQKSADKIFLINILYGERKCIASAQK